MAVDEQAALPPWPAPPLEPVTSIAELELAANTLRSAKAIGVAIASDHPGDPRGDNVRLLALIAADERSAGSATIVDPDTLSDLSALAHMLEADDAPYVVFHDAQRCLRLLENLELRPRRWGCTMTAATLLAEGADRRHDQRPLAWCVATYLEHRLEPADASTRLPQIGASEPESLSAAASTLAPLMRKMTPELRQHGLLPIYELECKLLPAVIAMERAGFGVDAPRFQKIADSWVAERESASAPDRIARLDKLISTYAHWARDFVDLDGRIRCRLHPLAADSGRFSCTDPNLQQVPNEHTAPGLRGCFTPAEKCRFVIADYAQIELRVAAHLAPCDALRRVFREGRDPHRATAATITGKPEHAVSSRERQMAKAVNFGFLFGMGAARFQGYARDSYGVELDADEAQRARAAFFDTFPGIAAWHRTVGELERRRGDVTVCTAMGRRKRFPAGKFSFNAALNIPVQGTAAEGFKLAMLALAERLPELGGRGVLCVHDEYLAEVPQARADEARELVQTLMRDQMATLVTSVPIVVEAKVTASWAEK